MPCSDGGPSPGDEYREQARRLTKILCWVLEQVRRKYPVALAEMLSENVDLHMWHDEHDRQDRATKAREADTQRKRALRESALAKLSAQERAVLGLNKD